MEELGSDAYLFASLPGHDSLADVADVIVRIDPKAVPAKGQPVVLHVHPDELHVFSAASGGRLN